MISAGEFRKGTTIEYEGNIYVVVDFQHVKPGKGSAFVRTRLKNIITGSVLEKTFNPTEKFENAVIETKRMTYSYNDGDFYYFMDLETYEQIGLDYDTVKEALNFIKEESEVNVSFYNGNAFAVDPPTVVELLITICEPAVRGNTATPGTKPATLETGYKIQVPMFINEGEKIKVDTRTGTYVSRA